MAFSASESARLRKALRDLRSLGQSARNSTRPVPFAAYYRALAANDVSALIGFLFDSSVTIRYGNTEVLYGFGQIKAHRSTVAAPAHPNPERTVITTFGRDFATASTLHRRSSGKLG